MSFGEQMSKDLFQQNQFIVNKGQRKIALIFANKLFAKQRKQKVV